MKPWDKHAFNIPAEPVHCKDCEIEIDPRQDVDLCETCYETKYCECGRRLEDGIEGPDFCMRCR